MHEGPQRYHPEEEGKGMSRREFLKKAVLLAGGIAAAGAGAEYALKNLLDGKTHTESPKEESPEQSAATNADDAWLEKQFENEEVLSIEGHLVHVLDIKPREAKTEAPVVMAPGYGTLSPADSKVNILEMARQGRRTLFVDEPRGVDGVLKNEKSEEQRLAEEKIEKFFLRQAETLIAVLDKKGIEQTDAVGHSEGCLYLVVAASLYPERFRNLVLFDPAGMVGDDSPASLAYRFLKENIAETIETNEKRSAGVMSAPAEEQTKRGDKDFLAYLKEDLPESIDEVRSIAKQQIRTLLKRAHAKGVMISIVQGIDDNVFPMDRVQEQASRTDPEKGRREGLIVDGFYSVKGGHDEFLLDPERYTRIADLALTALEEKRKSEILSEAQQ